MAGKILSEKSLPMIFQETYVLSVRLNVLGQSTTFVDHYLMRKAMNPHRSYLYFTKCSMD